VLPELIPHPNPITGLRSGPGIRGSDPVKPDPRDRREARRTGEGRPLPDRRTAERRRDLARSDVGVTQLDSPPSRGPVTQWFARRGGNGQT
jgi:transposase